MNKAAGSVVAFIFLHSVAFCQVSDYVQNPTFGIHFLFNDFKTASYIRANSLSAAFRDKQFGRIKDMSPGLALNYIQGLNRHFDFTTTLSGSFLTYNLDDGTVLGESDLLLEGDVSIRGKMFTNKYWVSPYIQLGTGISKYKGYWGAYIPAGIGIQVNFFDEAFLLVNSQYRIRVTENASHHFYYSIGLAGIIGKKKSASRPLPPPPFPAPPVDSDDDGILDTLDACPDVKGLAVFNGCPDTDSDGIADKDDQCPTVRGTARYKGCPVPDTDGDGINDEEDKCPQEKGLGRYLGCPAPDRDKDGVNDEEDQCPDLAGTAAYNGCPEVKEEVRRQVEIAAENIFFVSGSYRLLSKSNKSLDEIARLMQEDGNLKLDIDGHTDNTGTAEKNQLLSEQRAKAVYDYLVKKGIEPARLQYKGFGQTRSIADNTTAKGRAENRRVEIDLHYN